MKVFIDPGHGGSDPGAVNSITGLREADVNLNVAVKLGRLLQAHGHSVQYARLSDETVTLSERAWQADTWGADYFISIHCNASDNPDTRGAETLCYRFETTAAAIAQYVQDALVISGGLVDRGVKAQDLAVLRLTNMPAIMVKLAFISNNQEADMLMANNFCQSCAEGIAIGFTDFIRHH